MTDTESQAGAAEGETISLEGDDFSQLLQKEFRPKSETAKSAVEDAVKTLAEYALQNTGLITHDALLSIDNLVAEIDKKLSEQINLILHHEDYLQLESAWRGLHFIVNNTETDEMLKIRVLNISKKDLGKTLKKFKGTAWDQSPIFKKLYEEEYGQFGGEPYGCLVGDYHFDHSPPDVELLGEMSKVAAAAHAPFITGAEPSLFQHGQLAGAGQSTRPDQDLPDGGIRALAVAARERGQPLSGPRDAALPWPLPLRLQDGPDRRVRLRGGRGGQPPQPLLLGECRLRHGAQHHALLQAVRLVHADPRRGIGRRARRAAGAHLPVGRWRRGHEVSHRDRHLRPPRGGACEERPDAAASTARTPTWPPSSARSPCTSPPNTTIRTRPPTPISAARLPYLFATCRFAHYLKCIVRDKIGSFKERADMQKWLQKWINNYVDYNAAVSSEEQKSRKPLAAAQVVVEEVEGNPGYYTSKFFLRPHYQLEGLSVSLRLVSKLPSEKGM